MWEQDQEKKELGAFLLITSMLLTHFPSKVLLTNGRSLGFGLLLGQSKKHKAGPKEVMKAIFKDFELMEISLAAH